MGRFFTWLPKNRLLVMNIALSAALPLLILSGLSAARASAGTNSVSFSAVEDTYSSAAAASSNFGSSVQLLNNNTSGQVQRSYLKFNVSGIPAGATINTASLQLTATAASSATANVKALTNNNWSESTLTYANAPAYNSAVISDGTPAPITAGPVLFNVGSYVTGNGVWSMVITQSQATQTSWSSREGGSPPQLNITYTDTSTAPSVSVTSPAAGAIVKGSQDLTAQATDSAGVASVQFQVDGTAFGSPLLAPPYSTPWDTTQVADGTHQITAVATNTNNVSTTSLPVSVTVQNVTPPPSPTPPPPTPTPTPDPVIAAAGDIACEATAIKTATTCQQLETSQLLDGVTNVLALGDTQYNSGSYSDYVARYSPSWGQYKSITKPVPGNHEGASASGYYQYFGAVAGAAGKGYYSYDVGTWHVLAINSNQCALLGCSAGTAQEQWVKADLAAHPAQCTLAYWHQPRWASGSTMGDNTYMSTIYSDLYTAKADVLLAGHNHAYERFYPMDPGGTRNDAAGIQEIIVGTGGRDHSGGTALRANSVLRNNTAFGVLKMTLHPGSYDWKFVSEAGQSFSDSGSRSCH